VSLLLYYLNQIAKKYANMSPHCRFKNNTLGGAAE